mgnify:CR=1 FL=1
MFEFAWPWIFVLLPLPWLMRLILPVADSGEPALKVSFLADLEGRQIYAIEACGDLAQRQIQQDQVAQAVFAGALAGHAPVAQGQHRIADPQQARTVTLNDVDALFAQAWQQLAGNAQVAFDHAAFDAGVTDDVCR